MNFGVGMRTMRAGHGMSQGQLAKDAGVSLIAVSRCERGKKTFTAQEQARIRMHLRWPPENDWHIEALLVFRYEQ